jgi:drug/metabolite transporter (DMT)-like permease
MSPEILIILACVPLYVINSFCDKFVSQSDGNKFNYVYNCIKFLLCSLCMIPLLFVGGASLLGVGALICGVACGVMYALSKTVMLKGYECSSVAFMTLCHASGMILPCVIGHFFWSEKLSLCSLVGIFLAVASIVLLKGSSREDKKLGAMGILFGLIIFLTSAGVMIAQKLMGIYFSGDSVGAYNFYSFVVAFLILCFFSRPRELTGAPLKDKKKVILCAAGSAVSLSLISFVMTSLAGSVPSVILFPLFNGSGIILVSVGSAFVFGEKFNFKKAIGLSIGVIGLCLVNI